MTIPITDRPSYEPGQLPRLRESEVVVPRPRQGPVSLSQWVARVLPFAIAGACFAFSILGALFARAAEAGVAIQTRQILAEIRVVSQRERRQVEVEGDLSAVESLAERGELSWAAAATLFQRYQLARADLMITGSELESLRELVHDIAVGGGDIDLARYPEMHR